MSDLVQQLDFDYYRAARLLIARAELEQLRQECSRAADVEGRSEIPIGTSTPKGG
jgi:hypothetical protein